MEKIYTLQQISKILGLSERTLFRSLKQGTLKGAKIGHWRFTEQDIKDFLNKHRPRTTSKKLK